ncbi:DUF1653 domain-containing protein [Singulisphaera sp. PoT]|uniref:DUF1653 domain-containing protein n=1 Tax=Singulisphaera sp. PoT TaxID=3411797 RepID=UPI003BF5E71C
MSERRIKIGGYYRHFKGGLYRVHMLAIDSEASKEGREEKVVVYECLPDRGYFVRPYSMFMETVERDGKTMPRFAEIEDQDTLDRSAKA